ncbi:hypothetical protein [Staphylococcus phage PMBT9]|nr:hypothetical protein [Staphylococcus phage PMBT9]
MVKIKTIKKMNLPELIQWCWDNDITFKTFFGGQKSAIYFDRLGQVSIHGSVPIYKTFEVEIEEEITEETVIPDLIELFEHTGGIDAIAHSNASIHKIIRGADEDAMSAVSLYMLNNDMTMTLIWHNGEMVG